MKGQLSLEFEAILLISIMLFSILLGVSLHITQKTSSHLGKNHLSIQAEDFSEFSDSLSLLPQATAIPKNLFSETAQKTLPKQPPFPIASVSNLGVQRYGTDPANQPEPI